MPEWGWALVGAVGAPLIGFFWQALLKRENTERWGRLIGSFISRFLHQKLGVKGGDSVRDRFKSTAEDFMRGLKSGLDEELGSVQFIGLSAPDKSGGAYEGPNVPDNSGRTGEANAPH
jgi:hypothetical protein